MARLCPYCRCGMQRPRKGQNRQQDPYRRTRDHIRPRGWGGSDTADNIRHCCGRCNQQRAQCSHCIGALACARAVARDTGAPVAQVIRVWRFVAIDNLDPIPILKAA